jgi:two-component system, chemotaxis family, sensor histidine kinase and response regulator PixL
MESTRPSDSTKPVEHVGLTDSMILELESLLDTDDAANQNDPNGLTTHGAVFPRRSIAPDPTASPDPTSPNLAAFPTGRRRSDHLKITGQGEQIPPEAAQDIDDRPVSDIPAKFQPPETQGTPLKGQSGPNSHLLNHLQRRLDQAKANQNLEHLDTHTSKSAAAPEPTPVAAPKSPNENITIPRLPSALAGLDGSGKTSNLLKSKLTDYYLATTVRVDLKRLTQLNNLVGELVTQENVAQLQNQQYHGIVGSIEQRFAQFEEITRELRSWLDQSQNTRASSVSSFPGHSMGSGLMGGPRVNKSSESAGDFDPLMMDYYSNLYTLANFMMEEIAQLGEAVLDMKLLTQQAKLTQRKRQQTLKHVRDSLLRARMLPVADLLQRFPRMVRDLSVQYNKRVDVKLNGTGTLLDKAILEKLLDPLVHLVRNAFDHGIEMPDKRHTLGKAVDATIEIRAYHRGNQTYIEVRDDGRGIDPEKIRKKVENLGLLPSEKADALTRAQLYEYIFEPGFSTAAQVSELSGRGVGLDAVRTQVRQLKGNISLKSELGKGTTFTLRFPLTLTTANLVVFRIQTSLLALPVDTLAAITNAALEDIEIHNGEQFFRWQDKLVPIYPPDALLGQYPLLKKPLEPMQSVPLSAEGEMPLLLISGESELLALPVDEVIQEQELVIKPFGSVLAPPSYLYGCTTLGDGSPASVIDGQALIMRHKSMSWSNFAPAKDNPMLAEWARLSESEGLALQLDEYPNMPGSDLEIEEVPTILVVDDSLTARQFLTMTLEKGGYRVIQAKDGRDAMLQLQQESRIRAVFCDVEMPRMNGFEFLSRCREEFAASAPPVIMLTSRSSEKHVQMAESLGAASYLTKPYLEDELLQTLMVCLKR